MPITRFLQGQIFDLEHVRAMSDAFSDACNTLGLADRDDALTALVAGHIIKLARKGVRSKTALCPLTLEEFTAKPHSRQFILRVLFTHPPSGTSGWANGRPPVSQGWRLRADPKTS